MGKIKCPNKQFCRVIVFGPVSMGRVELFKKII